MAEVLFGAAGMCLLGILGAIALNKVAERFERWLNRR
jgi:hypothetical protein